MIDNDENIDEMVDEIFGDIDAGKRPYKLACVECGDVFEAKTTSAKYCPDCLKKKRAEGGRKGAEKAHGIKTEEKPKAAGASPRPTDADQGGERIAAAPAGPRNDEGDVGIRKTPPVTREALLEMACRIVSGERESQYGSPEDSFTAIADYWTVYLHQTGSMPEHRELTAEDTAIMMILLKVARQAGRGKLDNWIDIAGYAACGAEITAEGGTMARFESPIKVERVKTPTYNMTQAQIDQIKREAHREGLRAGTYAANAMYSVALLLALRDVFGFGRKRLTRAFRAVQKLFDEIAADEIAYRDAAQALRDECGINLTIERPKGTPVDALQMFHQMELAKAGYRVKLR